MSKLVILVITNQDSTVSIVLGYGLDSWSLIPGRDKRFVSNPQCPDQFWCPTYLMFGGYLGSLQE
jgi:hypothetical protein